jgi:hypothetical protein
MQIDIKNLLTLMVTKDISGASKIKVNGGLTPRGKPLTMPGDWAYRHGYDGQAKGIEIAPRWLRYAD